jgi:GntR family transcriptional regulator of arabinose operon
MKQQTNVAVIDNADAPASKRYEQAKAIVEEYIASHGLLPGDKLPTEDSLRRSLGWSRVTIARALDALVWEGKLRRVQGSGTYVTSPQASSRRAYKMLVSSWPFSSDDVYGHGISAGIRDEAAERGVEIVFHSQTAVPDLESVRAMGVDGVLSVCWKMNDLYPFIELYRSGVSIVGISMRSRIGEFPLVCIDNFQGTAQAVEHLYQQGHRDIAFATLSIDNSDVTERLLGFQSGISLRGLRQNPDYMLLYRDCLNATIVEAWWKSLTQRPTALLLHATAAPQVLLTLVRLGVTIPGELSIVLMDDVRATKLFTPQLTVLTQPCYDLGRRGLAKLIKAVEGLDDGRMEILPMTLVEGASVARITS